MRFKIKSKQKDHVILKYINLPLRLETHSILRELGEAHEIPITKIVIQMVEHCLDEIKDKSDE